MADDEHDHDHSHGELRFLGTDVTEATLAQIRDTHAPLAECLELTRRWGELSDEEKKAAPEKQNAVENHAGWTPGYHSSGDRCATCGQPTLPLFADRFDEGELRYAAFASSLPVHATRACLDGLVGAQRDLSPRGLDKARRSLMRDLERPSPRMSQFLRHDLLAHPPFGLEDWANSVAEAQSGKLDRAAMKDIERLMRWVHQQLFHHH